MEVWSGCVEQCGIREQTKQREISSLPATRLRHHHRPHIHVYSTPSVVPPPTPRFTLPPHFSQTFRAASRARATRTSRRTSLACRTSRVPSCCHQRRLRRSPRQRTSRCHGSSIHQLVGEIIVSWMESGSSRCHQGQWRWSSRRRTFR